MKKVIFALCASLLLFGMVIGLSSCGTPETTEDVMEEYITPLSESISKGYGDFDIAGQVKDADGKVIKETKIILYRNVGKQPFLFVSNDDPSTEGVDEQILIHITEHDVVNQVYTIHAGEVNTTSSEMSDEELNNIIADIYNNYFVKVLPENPDCITDSGRIYLKFFGTYSNYEVRYKSSLKFESEEDAEPELYDCLLQFNSKTDKIHVFKAAAGEGANLVSLEITYNYPMLNGNLFTKEIPTLDKMIQDAKTSETATSEETNENTEVIEPSTDVEIDSSEPEQTTEVETSTEEITTAEPETNEEITTESPV